METMRTTFEDIDNKSWRIAFDAPLIKRIRSDKQVDLLAIGDKEQFTQLDSDFITIVDVIWICCESQANERGINEIDFARRLTGDVLGHAIDAMWGALIDFFPQPKRSTLQLLVQKTRLGQERAAGVVAKAMESPKLMEAIEAETQRMVNQAIDKMRFQSATELPGS